MKKFWRTIRKWLLYAFLVHLAYILWVWILPPPVTLTQVNSMLQGNGLKRDWVSLRNIHPNMPLAVMAAEDQVFPDHNGFDWESIQKAMDHNKAKPNRVRGASTISQQVAKNVFLWQGRSWLRKGLEVYYTFIIETLYSKRRIMELYLNVAQTGKGMYGVEAAAQDYFGKSAKTLTRTQAARIAASLPNPVRYTVKPLSAYVTRRAAWVLVQMRNLEGDPEIQAIIHPPEEKPETGNEAVNKKRSK